MRRGQAVASGSINPQELDLEASGLWSTSEGRSDGRLQAPQPGRLVGTVEERFSEVLQGGDLLEAGKERLALGRNGLAEATADLPTQEPPSLLQSALFSAFLSALLSAFLS